MPSQSAIFLARIGAEAYKLFETFEFTHHDDCSDLAAIMAVFENHCIGEVNAVYIRGLKMAASRHLMRVVLQASLSERLLAWTQRNRVQNLSRSKTVLK